ncbi:MAG TPA: hypothetical protein PLI95_04570 [Polyangiaceae bacterium]|nr:hypothetical protein [Polyangiaceae bacterium]
MRRRAPWACWAAASLLALGTLRCGSSMDDASGDSPPYPNEEGYAGSGGTGAAGAAGAAGSGLPPEEELESSYRSPVATGRFVWVANPTSGRVAYVDAVTLEVQTVPAGHGPTYMAAVPDDTDDVALAINVGSSDASVLRRKPQAGLVAKNVPIHADANSWSVSSSGRWAVAWSDARQAKNAGVLDAFQDVTVVDLKEGEEQTRRMTVGYRPVAVAFASDESAAFAVTQDGISVIDLQASGAPFVARLVPISDDPLEDAGSRDVSITPDGSYALVRRDGEARLTVVPLAGGELVHVELSGPCTDLDLAPDGTMAVAVVRDTNEVALLPIPQIAQYPTGFEVTQVSKLTVGSVSLAAEAPMGLLYSNVSHEQRIAVLRYDQSPLGLQPMKLYGEVSSAMLAANGSTGIVVHGGRKSFSALVLDPELPAKLIGSGGLITQVAISADGARTVLAARDDSKKAWEAFLVRGFTQQVDLFELSSPPIAVGMVPSANRAYVAQEHPEGRITFVDLDTGLARTLTGFELAARVVDGSEP